MRSSVSKRHPALNAAQQRILDTIWLAFVENQGLKQQTGFLSHAAIELDALDDVSRKKLFGIIWEEGSKFAKNQELLFKSYFFFLTKSDAVLKELSEMLWHYTESLTEVHYLLWKIRASLFQFAGNLQPETEEWIREQCMRPTYSKTVENILYCISNDEVYQPRPELKKVGIVLSQFIGHLHAPSRTALMLATGLSREAGLQIQILNTNTMPVTRPLDYFYCSLANVNGNLVGKQQIAYDDPEFGLQTIEIYSDSPDAFTLERLVGLWNYIESEQFDALINLGDNLFTTDYFYGKVPILTIPLQRDIPISWGDQAVLVHDALTETEQTALANYGTKPPYLGFRFNVAPQKSKHLVNPAAYDLPEDAFVFAVVGNRLRNELDDNFMALLQELASADSRHYVVLVGDTARLQTFWDQQNIAPESRLRLVPHQDDLAAFYSLCDVFLNPNRSGGGVSSQMALAAHIPVLTLPHGDVATALPPSFHCQSYDEMREKAMALSQNPELLRQWQFDMAEIYESRKNGLHNVQIIHQLLSELHQDAIDRFEQSQKGVAQEQAPLNPS